MKETAYEDAGRMCSLPRRLSVFGDQAISVGAAVAPLRSKIIRPFHSLLKSTSGLCRNTAAQIAVLSGFIAGEASAAALIDGSSVGSTEGALALDQSSVLLLAIFVGAVSFSFLAVFWMIRERARISEENERLRKSFSGMRADRDRLSSLLEVDDLCIVVWSGEGEKPQVIGALDASAGAPQKPEDFLAFGKWLTPNSAIEMERAIQHLKVDGQQFTLELVSQSDHTLEAQGRVSGGQAFVRFIVLDGTREKLAALTQEHRQLATRFELIEKLFDHSPSPIWLKDAEGKLSYVNPAYAKAVESANADEAVRDARQLFDTKERELIKSELQEKQHHIANLPAVAAGDRRMMETIAVRSDHGYAGIAIDRSDVDAVRATLKNTIASHQQTFDHLGSAVAIFDAKQKLQFHNSSFQQMWGLSASDLEGHPSNGDLLEILRSKSRLQEMPDWKKWKDHQLEIYHATEARAEHWHLPDGSTLRVIVNPQNQGGASWVFENVTEELALKSNYNSLIRVQGETLDHLNEAVAVFGSDGKVRLTNPAFLTLWNFDGQDAVEGHHIRDVSKNISRELRNADEWETISLGITGVDDDRADLNGRLELTKGTVLDYHLVYLPEGQSMLTLADVTAAVNIERALQDRNDALEESDALKTRFIQNVSYELRAPLTSISGFTEIMTSGGTGELNAKQAEYLEYITRSSDVLKALIDDILDLASIDAGAMQLDHDRVDLAEVVQESLDALAEKIDRFQIKADVQINPNTAGFVADRTRMRQIIYNLASNAVTVSPDGGRISITAWRDGTKVFVSVADQGPGIPEENRATIFNRFESGQGGEKRRGAGLGLSIVKSFVELHGGQISIDEKVTSGACFTCVFPFEPTASLQAAE